ncbi:mesothelin-like protein [Accipiter gentilis]|uniref:mesothelin-like protein n=1 Tax=Astur gentilis TaxID=8957 RepID=UPI00211038E0|nr:mesothelin-like protein [Accipiter gentilis]
MTKDVRGGWGRCQCPGPSPACPCPLLALTNTSGWDRPELNNGGGRKTPNFKTPQLSSPRSSSPSTRQENRLRDPHHHPAPSHPVRQPAPSQSVGQGSPFALSARLTGAKDEAPAQAASMVWAASAPAAIALCLRFSADLMKAAAAALVIGAVLSVTGQHADLGALVCDMEPETITASDPGVLENLKLCSALAGAQRDALNAVLLGGGTVYGDPSSWDLQTLQNLGPLVLALNQTTLSLVAEAAREAFGRSIVAAYGSQGRSQREKSLTLLRAFAAAAASSHPRLKRSADREHHLPDMPSLPAGCLSKPITASTVSDPFLLISYDTAEQFDLCLSNEVLKANLKPLLEQPLTVEYLRVMKKKLEQIYPSEIPEEQLKLLGPLSRQYTAEEISRWPVTSSNTLSALLDPSDGKWEASQVQQLLSRYLALGGTLTGPLLQKIGGRNLCNLQEKQINQIPPAAIRTAGQLNISSCSQIKKDQLYRKAQEAFADQAGTTRAYYCQIWPYLGGAPAKDLKDLAEAGVAIDMDIETFLSLNPDELQKLSVMDVKNLLGENLRYLKEAENETSVMRWVKKQSQRELDCTLGIGLQGGTEEPSPTGTATPPHPTASATITPTVTVPAPTTLPTLPSPIAISSHPTPNSSTSPPKAPSPSTISPTPPNNTPPRAHTTAPSAVSPTATSTARPAPTTGSIVPCSIHQSPTPNKATPPAVTLLTTILASGNPNATSPSSVPPPALTRGATSTTTSAVTNPAINTSTPLVSVNPPAPGATAHPAPETNLPPKPTPIPNSTLSTQKSVISPAAKSTTSACKTSAPPAFPGPSSTTTSSETTKETPTGVPEPPRPTPGGYINLQPEAGSGSRLSSCLVHILTTAVGSSLLRALL